MLGSLFSALRGRDDRAESERKPHRHLAVTAEGLREMLRRNWHLPFTSFGGPAVHFQIFHRLFVDKYHWMDERTYQEMFALCQALSGPGSTKMLYAINVLRHGFLTGVLAFFLWSLPTAIATFGLALGVSRIGETLPGPVYALLSGLNSATVGIIFLAAVQLSKKAITDKVTRILVFFGAAAGVLYNALWYFPILMLAGAIVTAVWDYRWGHRLVKGIRDRFKKHPPRPDVDAERQATSSSRDGEEMQDVPRGNEKSSVHEHDSSGLRRVGPGGSREGTDPTNENAPGNSEPESAERNRATDTAAAAEEPATDVSVGAFSLKVGISVGVGFFLVFIAVMVLRALLDPQPRWYGIFANHFLAGTIIFGGGPVVIPLLREYVVVPGWVTPRDFLLGLAIIQAFPGPNFNFAVYLGGLAAISGGEPAVLGSALAYIGIFTPGLVLHTAVMGIWAPLRRKSHKAVFSVLRGVNATAVGLIYTAVYRLWEAGYLDAAGGSSNTGRSLGADPWWIVVTATAFIGGMYFKVPAPVAIVLGAIMGLIWYGITA